MENFFQNVEKQLKRAGIATSSTIRGCTAKEIETLEKQSGVKLPESYKGFLARFGKQAGQFFTGEDCFYDRLRNLRADAEFLLKENNEPFTLPQDIFVFSMHQGYEFLFFSTNAGDNPPVAQYVEGQGPPQIVWSKFTDFLIDAINQHVKFFSDR